ncbi:MAG TPA: hypothetical protein VMY34_01675, partial [Acidimicrobiales bacterium]|nr:hypothetical protein [Acidimicrobiales bacterium]
DAKNGGALTEAEFVAKADKICLEVSTHFGELKDPDGEGGAKPLGIGGLIRDWVSQLRTLVPPADVADDWTAGLDLLDQSADKLDQAEGGDEDAQSDALFGLQAEAQEHFDAMGMPFKGCFVE